VFTDVDKAKKHVDQKGVPIVIKADGLAAGKGVTVALTKEDALNAIDQSLVNNVFGSAGNSIVIEECMQGEEASILVISDGEDYLIFDASQDFKRAYDDNKGPNTGGMGAYSPVASVNPERIKEIDNTIVAPMIQGMKKEGIADKGILYAGIMLTEQGPKVVEFNVRFGDPETQAVLPRMKTDLVELMLASIDGTLKEKTLEWDERVAVGVVLASGGYPASYEKGKEITGLDNIETEDVIVFHAGTTINEDKIVTSGGRVLNIVGFGKTLSEARDNAYKKIKQIKFKDMEFRRDIALRASGCQ
jgi:phosphoribosylamine--glycine ligase